MEKITKKRKSADASPDKVIWLVSNGVQENDREHKTAVFRIGNRYYYRKPIFVNKRKEDNGASVGGCQVDSQEVAEKRNQNVTDECTVEAQVDLQEPEEGMETLKEIEVEIEDNGENHCNAISDSISNGRKKSLRVMEPEMEDNVGNGNRECDDKSQTSSPEERESLEKPTQTVKIEYNYDKEDDAGGSSDMEIIENPNLADEEAITYLLTKEDFALLDRANMDTGP